MLLILYACVRIRLGVYEVFIPQTDDITYDQTIKLVNKGSIETEFISSPQLFEGVNITLNEVYTPNTRDSDSVSSLLRKSTRERLLSTDFRPSAGSQIGCFFPLTLYLSLSIYTNILPQDIQSTPYTPISHSQSPNDFILYRLKLFITPPPTHPLPHSCYPPLRYFNTPISSLKISNLHPISHPQSPNIVIPIPIPYLKIRKSNCWRIIYYL